MKATAIIMINIIGLIFTLAEHLLGYLFLILNMWFFFITIHEKEEKELKKEKKK